MRTRMTSLVLLLAVGCATPGAAPPDPAAEAVTPAAVPPDPAREARIQEVAQLKTQATALTAQSQPAKAITLLERAVRIDSDDPEAHGMLGSLLLQTGRYPLAALSFERVLELTPEDPRVYVGLGTAYEKMGRFKEAKAPLIKALEYYPNDSSLMAQLGHTAYATKDYELCARTMRSFLSALSKSDPAQRPETYKKDYQQALSFTELCESKAK
jgi:Flp pilus assembly protein TadD